MLAGYAELMQGKRKLTEEVGRYVAWTNYAQTDCSC